MQATEDKVQKGSWHTCVIAEFGSYAELKANLVQHFTYLMAGILHHLLDNCT